MTLIKYEWVFDNRYNTKILKKVSIKNNNKNTNFSSTLNTNKMRSNTSLKINWMLECGDDCKNNYKYDPNQNKITVRNNSTNRIVTDTIFKSNFKLDSTINYYIQFLVDLSGMINGENEFINNAYIFFIFPYTRGNKNYCYCDAPGSSQCQKCPNPIEPYTKCPELDVFELGGRSILMNTYHTNESLIDYSGSYFEYNQTKYYITRVINQYIPSFSKENPYINNNVYLQDQNGSIGVYTELIDGIVIELEKNDKSTVTIKSNDIWANNISTFFPDNIPKNLNIKYQNLEYNGYIYYENPECDTSKFLIKFNPESYGIDSSCSAGKINILKSQVCGGNYLGTFVVNDISSMNLNNDCSKNKGWTLFVNINEIIDKGCINTNSCKGAGGCSVVFYTNEALKGTCSSSCCIDPNSGQAEKDGYFNINNTNFTTTGSTNNKFTTSKPFYLTYCFKKDQILYTFQNYDSSEIIKFDVMKLLKSQSPYTDEVEYMNECFRNYMDSGFNIAVGFNSNYTAPKDKQCKPTTPPNNAEISVEIIKTNFNINDNATTRSNCTAADCKDKCTRITEKKNFNDLESDSGSFNKVTIIINNINITIDKYNIIKKKSSSNKNYKNGYLIVKNNKIVMVYSEEDELILVFNLNDYTTPNKNNYNYFLNQYLNKGKINIKYIVNS